MALNSVVAIFSIVFGLVGIVGILAGYILIHKKLIGNAMRSLGDLSETVDELNSTIRNASEFLGGSTDLLDGISRVFYDMGGSLPLVGRSFKELGRSLGVISTNMHGFRQSIDSFEGRWSGSLEKIGSLGKDGLPKIKILMGVLMAWLIGLHLVLILIGLTLMS